MNDIDVWFDQLSILERGKEDYATDRIIKDPDGIIKRRIHIGFIRQQIEKYTEPGQLVWDPFGGSGSTALAALYSDRKAVINDIGELEINHAKLRLNLPLDTANITIEQADMLKYDIKDVDFVFTAPPVFDLSTSYSKVVAAEGRGEKSDIVEYGIWLDSVAQKIYDAMKPQAYAAIYTCDIRKDKFMIPGSFYMMKSFMRHFKLVDVCIIDLRNDSRRKRRVVDLQENSRKRHSQQHDYMQIYQKI